MAEFRKLSDTMWASPQITIADVVEAKELGISLIINNRPDGEEPGAPQEAEIQLAADEAGIQYLGIPVTHAGFSMPQVEAMADALSKTDTKVLGYCRSGTRTTLLWAMARAKLGDDAESIAAAAAQAGYDISPVRATMDMLAPS